MKKWIITGAVLMSVCGAQAQTVLAAWNAQTPSTIYPTLAVVSNAANLTASVFSTSEGLTANESSSHWSWKNWNISAVPELTKYWEFTLTPSVGKQFSVSQLGIRMRYTSASYGPTSWVVRASTDSYATDIASYSTVRSVTNTTYTVAVSGITNQLDAITFRIYGFNNSAGSPTTRSCGIAPGGTAEGNVHVKGSIADSGPLSGTLCIVK